MQATYQEAVAELSKRVAVAQEALVLAEEQLLAQQAAAAGLQDQLAEALDKTTGLEASLGELLAYRKPVSIHLTLSILSVDWQLAVGCKLLHTTQLA